MFFSVFTLLFGHTILRESIVERVSRPKCILDEIEDINPLDL